MPSGSAESDIYAETLAVFETAEPGEPLTTPEVADALDLGRRTVYERLTTLVDDGALATKKVGSGARVWWRPMAEGIDDDRPPDYGAGGEAPPSPTGGSRSRDRFRTIERTAEHLATVVSNVPVILFGFDEDGTITLSEGKGLRTLGFEPGQLVGASLFELYEDYGDILDDLERALAGEPLRTIREVEGVVFETVYQPVVDGSGDEPPDADDGEVCEVIAVAIDITERVERERELERFERIVDAVGDPVYELDADGYVRFVNEAFVEELGYEREELLDRHVSTGMDAADVERAEALIAELLADGDAASATLEFEVETAAGERIPVENHLAVRVDDDGRYLGSAGVLRDVTERRQRERRYQSLVENLPGIVCFSEVDPSWPLTAVYGECEELTGYAADELVEDVSWGEEVLHPDERERIYDEVADALETDGTYEVTYRIRTRDGEVRWMWERGNLIEADLLHSFITDVTERNERERQLSRQQDRLAALNNLHDVVREITDAVLERSTREEIEEAVCRHLAESESYEFAWIAEVDPETGDIAPRAEAGVDGYMETGDLTTDPDRTGGRGPAGTAVRTTEMQVSRDVFADPDFEPWRDVAAAYGYRSCAAIPVVHEGTLYGLIGVYSAREDAFTEDERDVVGQLGEIVGHAISAADRKRAMMSDEVVEIGLRLRQFFRTLGLAGSVEGTAEFRRLIPVGDGSHLLYGIARDGAMSAVERLADAEEVPHWEAVSVLGTDGGATRFEARLADAPFASVVSAHGGYFKEARLVDGDLLVRVHLAPGAEIQRLIDDLRESYPGVEPVTRRQKTVRRRTAERFATTLDAELTDRQRAALEAGYAAGFFEWPRDSSGEDVADALDISPATFHQHVRTAERKLLDELFADR